ncbi:ATP-dependent RNA helicase DDX51-like [Sycon ciliatum]|uniref:ATP-dependent RNA helicase DDX51-like n=1 Tax=Sycon ciliatum TaxID=27933 RepID=UPI0031F6AD8D
MNSEEEQESEVLTPSEEDDEAEDPKDNEDDADSHTPATPSSQFQILGTGGLRSRQKAIESSLPEWLAYPTTIDYDLQRHQVSVDAVSISGPMRKTLKRNGISCLFPVQTTLLKAICAANGRAPIHEIGLPPQDLCVSAPTGSGKTLAYGIPVIERLSCRVVPAIRALVLLPTRDLAQQVFRVLKSMSAHTDLEICLATGQTDFAKEQATISSEYVDIVVATPGRLVDHISSTPGFSLKQLEFLVLDEADRLLDQPFQDWLGKVHAACGFAQLRATSSLLFGSGHKVRKMLFSATLTQDPEKLSKLMLFRPRLFTVVDELQLQQQQDQSGPVTGNFAGRYSTPAALTERIIICDGSQKPLLIYHLVKDQGFRHVLCFTGSLESTHRLYTLLKIMGGITVEHFSSELTRGHRMRLLENFKLGRYQLLICSDAMARGMDIEKVEHVISYDAPQFIKTHIHRMGRTARAGRSGDGYTVLRPEEVHHYKAMMRAAGKDAFKKLKVSDEDLQAHFDLYEDSLGKLQTALQASKDKSRGKKRKRT